MSTVLFLIKKAKTLIYLLSFAFALLFLATKQGYAAFVNASGYVGFLGVTQIYPNAGANLGRVQGTEQFARVNVQIIPGDLMNLNLNVGLWPSYEGSYFGSESSDYYNPALILFNDDYTPKVWELYLNLATRYCLVTAGRKARHVGSGMFLNDSYGHFDAPTSLYEGLSCEVNTSGSFRAFSLTLGVDKLNEGELLVSGDDTQQFYAHLIYDDLNIKTNLPLKKRMELYFAWVNSTKPHFKGKNQEKYLDLFTGLYWGYFAFEFEGLLRMGEGEGKSWNALGARPNKTAKVNSLAVATELTFSYPPQYQVSIFDEGNKKSLQSEQSKQPTDKESDSSQTTTNISDTDLLQQEVDQLKSLYLGTDMKEQRHDLFVQYIFAPGDRDGYFKGVDPSLTATQRDQTLTAIALNPNFKPSIILFNTQNDKLDIEGVYSGSQIVNAHVVAGGYRYFHNTYGEIEAKVIVANMVQGVPRGVKSYFYYNDIKSDDRSLPEGYYELTDNQSYPVGYYGKHLGTEIDLAYTVALSELIELSVAGAVFFPGDAFDIISKDTESSSQEQKTKKTMFGAELGLAASF